MGVAKASTVKMVLRILLNIGILLGLATLAIAEEQGYPLFGSGEPWLEHNSQNATPYSGMGLTPTKTLSKRAPVKTYAECITTGACMLAYMDTVITPPSVYTDFAQISNSAWKSAYGGMAMSLTSVMVANRWDESSFHSYEYEYEQPWIPDPNGGTWSASYSLLISSDAGAIIIQMAFAPKSPLVSPGTDNTNPPLIRRLSDFAFLCYQQECESDITCMRRIQWIISVDITNPSAGVVTAKLLADARSNLRGWPGMKYASNTDAGKAMIGAPTGYGVAWFLSNRIIELGPKTIDETVLFADDSGRSPCWAFHIADAKLGWDMFQKQ